MNTTDLRRRANKAITDSGLGQYGFSVKTGLNYSWLTKFLQGQIKNPRLDTAAKLEKAVEKIAAVKG